MSIERLRAWAEGLPAGELVDEGEGAWTVRVGGELPTRVQVSVRAITVDVDPWSRTWPRDEDSEAEAVDLVAALWFGRARVEVVRRGERGLRWRMDVQVNGRWSPAAALRRWSLPWGAVQRSELCNAFAVPADLQWGEAGRLPAARWIGMVLPDDDPTAARELAIDGELDLHPFSPKEVGEVVRQYLDECVRRGVWQLRLVHGKGIGNLRRTVHAILAKHPAVESYRLGGHGEGSWGATVVTLRRGATE